MDRILLVGEGGCPNPDEGFIQRLLSFDKDLTVGWNKLKNRWVIEQCIEHHGGYGSRHSYLCRRAYVWLVQDEDGDMMPLCERVMSKLREMRAYSESFGGQTERGLRNFKQYTDSVETELRAERERKMHAVMQEAARDGKRQLEQVRHLMQQHDMRPNR